MRVGALGKAASVTRDPHGTQGNESDYLILSLVYDTLAAPGDKTNTAPRLAATWKPSEDLKTWRFTIAEGAKFHDGTPVTADDVVWSLKRLRGTPAGWRLARLVTLSRSCRRSRWRQWANVSTPAHRRGHRHTR